MIICKWELFGLEEFEFILIPLGPHEAQQFLPWKIRGGKRDGGLGRVIDTDDNDPDDLFLHIELICNIYTIKHDGGSHGSILNNRFN